MSFFRNFIDKPIQQELFNRIDSLNFNNSTQGLLDSVKTSVQHQFVKTCWARASVVLGEDDGNKVVSLNTNVNENNVPINRPLNIKNGNLYRGKPGITSISSNFKEYFLKQSTVNFFVPDPNEFDVFKKQFLRFGRYMLVEFGWSLPYNLQLPSLSGDTVLEISKDLQKRVLVGKGNYTALVGVVTNYTFNQTKEGAYEGTIELSSMGRNVIGQKSKSDGKIENLVGYVNDVITDVENQEETLKSDDKTIFKTLKSTFIDFNGTITALKDVIESYTTEGKDEGDLQPVLNWTEVRSVPSNRGDRTEVKTIEKQINLQIYHKKGTALITSNKSGSIFGKDRLAYCTWGWFEDYILNSFFGFVSEDETINFKTEFRSAREGIRSFETNDEGFATESSEDENDKRLLNNLCKTNDNLFSLGYNSILLNGLTKPFDEPNVSFGQGTVELFNYLKGYFETFFPKFETTDNSGIRRGQIRNMIFEVDYLIESFKGTQNIERSLNDFWQKVSDDYGGFWRFAIVEDDNHDGRMMVTDINIGEVDDRDIQTKLSTKQDPTKIFKFPIYSKDSIVSDFQISSENSAEMATLAVYGSNVNLDQTGADDGKGYTALAMRALSSLDNTFVSENKQTNETEKEKLFYDRVLRNIKSPIFGNFIEKGRNQGSSADYDDFGNPINIKRNEGILFDNVPEVQQTSRKIEKDLREQTENEQLYDIDRDSIRKGSFWFDLADTTVQIYNSALGEMYDEFKRTMLFMINKAPGDPDDLTASSNYVSVSPPVPIQLSLTLQGIGGIKVGDLFYVDYLPNPYRTFCHFMVVGVEHSIDTTGWTTKLDSRMIVDVPKAIKKGKLTQGRIFTPIQVDKSLSQTINDIVKKYEGLNKQILDAKDRREELSRASRIEKEELKRRRVSGYVVSPSGFSQPGDRSRGENIQQ